MSDLVVAPRRAQAEEPSWRQVPLGDLCRTTSGGTPSRKRPDYFQGPIPWVKSGELTDGPVSEVEEFITEEALANSSAKVFPAGTLLIALYGATVGKLGVLTRDAATNQAICAIFPPDELDTRFLFWYLFHRRADLVARAVGGAQPNISQAILRDLDVPVPPIAQQRGIVAELEMQFSRLDEAVANLKRVKANLDRYLAATLGEAFAGKWAGTKADWRPVPLREVADVQLGQQRAPVHAADLNRIPYIRAANVTWNGLDLSDVKSMGFPNAARYRLAYGDILLAEASGSANEVGKPAIWRDEIPGACYQKTLVRVRCQPNRLNYEFVYYFFLHTCLSGQFARLAPGVGILHLTAERMLVWPTTAPPLPVQALVVGEIERRLSIVREVEAEVDANLKRAGALRQAVLACAYQTSQAMESSQ